MPPLVAPRPAAAGAPRQALRVGLPVRAAVEPATGAEVALVLPEATAAAMNLFLAAFGRSLPDGVHAVLILDRAGWHGARALAVPANVTLVPLPP